jgi:lipid A disaccharide synthetase
VPELVQDDFTAERVVNELNQILPDGPRRQTMMEGLARVKTLLQSPDLRDPRPAAELAADAILKLMPQPSSRLQVTGDR